MKKGRITEKEIEDIKKLHYDGFSYKDIAAFTGYPEGSIGFYIRKVPTEPDKAKELLEKKVLSFRKRGFDVSEIAKVCEISENKTRAILDKALGGHRMVKTVYPAVTTWMNSNGLLQKDIASFTAFCHNGKPVPTSQVNRFLEGVTLITETTIYNRRCHAKAAIINTFIQMSGMSFTELFGEKDATAFPNGSKRKTKLMGCSYQKIQDWLLAENVTVSEIAAVSEVSMQTVKNLLKGYIVLEKDLTRGLHSYPATQRAIDTILTMSNMSYEEAFEEVFNGTFKPVPKKTKTTTITA